MDERTWTQYNKHGRKVSSLCRCVCVNIFCQFFYIYNFKCYCKVNKFLLERFYASCYYYFFLSWSLFVSSTFLLLLLYFFAVFLMLLCYIYLHAYANARSFRMDELTSSRNNKIFRRLNFCVDTEHVSYRSGFS